MFLIAPVGKPEIYSFQEKVEVQVHPSISKFTCDNQRHDSKPTCPTVCAHSACVLGYVFVCVLCLVRACVHFQVYAFSKCLSTCVGVPGSTFAPIYLFLSALQWGLLARVEVAHSQPAPESIVLIHPQRPRGSHSFHREP